MITDFTQVLKDGVSVVFWPIQMLDGIILHPSSNTSIWDVILILLILTAFLAVVWRSK